VADFVSESAADFTGIRTAVDTAGYSSPRHGPHVAARFEARILGCIQAVPSRAVVGLAGVVIGTFP